MSRRLDHSSELPQHGGHEIGQIFGEQAGTKLGRRGAMHPDAGRGRQERIHALGEQPQDQAAEDIAGTGRGECRAGHWC